MSVSFGIYVGSSSCCIAINKDGKFEVVANAAGDRVTPAVVAYHETEVVVGLAAKQGIIRHAANTIENVLRALSCTESERASLSNVSCVPIWENGQVYYKVQRGEKNSKVPAEEVLSRIFGLLKGIAVNQTNESVLPLVISVPAWASEKTVDIVKRAAKKASFNVMNTVSQPVAAIIAYGLLNDNKTNLNVVVLHGGGTTVVGSVMEIAGGLLTTKESITSTAVAGDTLTELLVQHFAKEFYAKYKGDPLESKRSKRKLYNASENCKHVLSTIATAQVYVESLWEGVDFSTTLSRARFEGLVSSALSGFLQPAIEAVQRCGLTMDKIHKVILSGGSAKIPRLQRLVRDAFPQAEFLCSILPDEVLAAGASVEAALLLGQPARASKVSMMIPALASSIYCMIAGSEVNECIFCRGTPTHSHHSYRLTLPSPPPSPCSIIIYEEDSITQTPAESAVLAQIDVTTFIESSKYVKADFHLKSDGSLHVTLQEPNAKVNQSFIIEAGRC